MGTEASRLRKKRHYDAHKNDPEWMRKRNEERQARKNSNPALREQDRLAMAERRAADPAASAAYTTRSSWLYRLKKRGISEEIYYQLVEAQGGVCAICGVDRPWPTRELEMWLVDHDHATGLARGLLCDNCNKGLGHFKDNLENLLKAIEYLKSPPISAIM